MTTADQLSKVLVAWRKDASEQLEKLRKSMGLSDYAERLRQLSAAATEVEDLRARLEAILREESRTGDHDEKVRKHIDVTHVQCKTIRPHFRKLVLTVSWIVEQRTKKASEHPEYAEVQLRHDDMVSESDAVEDDLQDLLDNVGDLTGLLRGNGDQNGTGSGRDEEPGKKAGLPAEAQADSWPSARTRSPRV